MTIYSNRVTVGTAAVELVPPSIMSQEVNLLNAGNVIVRLGGGPDMTTDAWGLPLIPADPNVSRTFFQTTIQPGDAVWGRTASGSAAVNIWVVSKS
jgi:hypothetical protein